MIELLERGSMYPPFDLCADAKAVCDAIAAIAACEPAASSLKLHLISVRDGMAHGLIRKFLRVDIRDVLADGLTKGGIGRLLLHNVNDDCTYQATHDALVRQKNAVVGSATASRQEDPPDKWEL